VGGRTNNPVLNQKYGHFEHQTVEHVAMLEELVTRLGGTRGTSARPARAPERTGLAFVESTFLLSGSVGLMTQELVMLDAVLLAEAKEHASWSGLAQLVDVVPAGEARDAVRSAVERVEPEEDEHLGWVEDMHTKLISAQVRCGAVQPWRPRQRRWWPASRACSPDRAVGGRQGPGERNGRRRWTAWASRRETCIWLTPKRRAICVCVRSSK
jgi:hypothetical protein